MKILMDPAEIFKKNFIWMKTIGIQFTNDESWKRRFLKYLVFLNIISATVNIAIRGYYMIFKVKVDMSK
jgi:hypothetical protein